MYAFPRTNTSESAQKGPDVETCHAVQIHAPDDPRRNRDVDMPSWATVRRRDYESSGLPSSQRESIWRAKLGLYVGTMWPAPWTVANVKLLTA
jgi:hypothetical protein